MSAEVTVSPFQTIKTKFVGTITYKGSRIHATCHAGHLTLSWDSALNADENYAAAAKALLDKVGWNGHYVNGSVKDGYVFVSIGQA